MALRGIADPPSAARLKEMWNCWAQVRPQPGIETGRPIDTYIRRGARSPFPEFGGSAGQVAPTPCPRHRLCPSSRGGGPFGHRPSPGSRRQRKSSATAAPRAPSSRTPSSAHARASFPRRKAALSSGGHRGPLLPRRKARQRALRHREEPMLGTKRVGADRSRHF